MFKNSIFKLFKAEKSSNITMPVGILIVLLFSVFSILSVIKSYSHYFSVKGFGYPLESIKLTFEAKDRLRPYAYLVCYSDYCKAPETNEFMSYYSSEFTPEEREFYEKKVDKIYLAVNSEIKEFPNNIKNIDINIGNKNIYLNDEDIKKLEKKEISVNLKEEDGKKEIKKYTLIKLTETNNYRGFFSHIANITMSLFYNWKFFILPYVYLMCAVIIFIFNREDFKFEIKPDKKVFYSIFALIMLLGAFLRFVDINYFPLWIDEVYTKHIALHDFASCFKDAGNPPLFFILEYLFTKVFSTANFALRFLPSVFGLLFIAYVFILFKNVFKNENNKMPFFALFAGFMASINTVNIYHSQEARGYTLCMFLTVASIYYLFRYLSNPGNKKLTIFAVFNALLLNSNYYLILLSITNYIWGIVDLAQNKNIKNNKKEILKYTLSYAIAGLTAIPYFVLSYKTALTDGFNGWILPLSKEVFLYTINEYFINKYIFIALCAVVLINLIILYLPKNILEKINIKINPKKENLYLYLVYTLTLIIILACFISVAIKPIFHKRVLLSIYSLLFLIEMISISTCIEFIKENKILKSLKLIYGIILTFACFTITAPMPTRGLVTMNDFMKFVNNDVKQYDEKYEIHLISSQTEEHLKEYPEVYNNKRIKVHYIDTNSGMVLTSIKKDDYITNGKKGVIYFNTLGVDVERVSTFNPAIKLHRTNSVTNAKLIY